MMQYYFFKNKKYDITIVRVAPYGLSFMSHNKKTHFHQNIEFKKKLHQIRQKAIRCYLIDALEMP